MGGRYYNAEPQHEVHVATFRISEYPMTNQQYAEFLAVTGYEPPEHWRGKTPPARIEQPPSS